MAIVVYDKNKQKLYTLDNNKEIARGGEGYLVLVPGTNDLVAKIYLPNCLNINESKFNYLNKLDDKYFIKPQELLYDKNGSKIVGITMKYLDQDYYPLDSIFNKSFCLQHQIDFLKKEKITNQLIEAVKLAHSLNIDIGDLSALNIMINNNGDVKLIDVDSYQVPGIKHSNKLLEDIRDYLIGGSVCKESDYFSLSVVIFNYLTHLHPFKGVHKKYPKLMERMIKKIPVFVKDPNLVIPKCYEPIQDTFLSNQYERLYLKGERFLISINKFAAPILGKIVPPQSISEKEVIIQTILSGEIIEYAYFTEKHGMLRTKNEFIFYDVNNKGMFFKRAILNRKEWKDVFFGNKNVIGTKNDKLYLLNINNGSGEEIINFELKAKARFVHLNNILIMIEDEYMWKVFLDEVKYKNILLEKQPVYGKGFNTYSGIIQNVGGEIYIHTNIGGKLNTLKSPLPLTKGIISRNNVGILKYEENKQLKYKYFNITDSKINLFQETDNLYNLTIREENNGSLIFIPNDNKIDVLRGMDFYKLAEIGCSVISTDSRLYNTNAGIVVVNENQSYLINKK